MPRWTSLTLRSLFLIGFIIAVPVLALPRITRLIDQALYGHSGATIPPVDALPAGQPMPQQVIEPQIAERTSPASYDAPASPTEGTGLRSGYEGLDALVAAPPPLAPLPNFPSAPAVPPTSLPASPSVEIRETMISQVQQIRERLELLGAKYILLETADGSGQFRFHCQMLLENSAYTRDFEATGPDPLMAAQTVLREVETWRTAARPAATRLE